MSIIHFQTVFLLFYSGSLACTKEQLYQDQFNFCWKQTIDNREENQTFCCSSGRIKFDDLLYCKNDTSTCVSNALCDINECCNGTDQHYFSVARALALYTNCSYETNCSVNWANEVFLPPGFQGHINNIVNYTCIKDSMVLKMCEDNVMTAGQVELVLDGKKPGAVSSGPTKCECSLSIDPNYGSFSVDLTDLRFAKPSNSSCSTAVLNIFGLSVGNCSAGAFHYKGTLAFTSNHLNKLSIEHLFELGVDDIPSMIWITIRGNSSSITVNCSALETIHDVTYYTYSTPRQTTSSTDHTPCTKMTTTQDDREHFSTTNAAETTGTTRAVGPVTNTTMSEISIQHGDSTSITVNSRAAQTIHNGTSYRSRVQTTPSSLYTSWTKLPITQDGRASYSPSNVTDNTGYSNSVKVNSSATQTFRSVTFFTSLTQNQTTPTSSKVVETTATQTVRSVKFFTSLTQNQTIPTSSKGAEATGTQTVRSVTFLTSLTQNQTTPTSSNVAETTGTHVTEGNLINASVSEPSIRPADSYNMVLIIELVVSIVGGVVIIISVILAVLCIRRRAKQKQRLRTTDFEVESYGENYHLFPPESTSNLRMDLHNFEDMGDSQNRRSGLFSDENINTSSLTVQEYDHITFEKFPRKGIPDYDIMMEGADIHPFDIIYSHPTSEPLSSKYSRADNYSHINFDKTRAMDQQNANLNTNTKLKEMDSDLHIELQSKSAFSNVNPTGMTEPTMNDCNSHPATVQSADHAQGSSCSRRETILDGDSYSQVDFNLNQSRDDKGMDMAIRIENGSKNYNYAKVKLSAKSKNLETE